MERARIAWLCVLTGLVPGVARAAGTGALVEAALLRAAEPGIVAVRVEPFRAPRRCRVRSAEADAPVAAPGRALVTLRGVDRRGRPCRARVVVTFSVVARALRVEAAVRRGEVLAGRVASVERLLRHGRPGPARLPEGARAARALAPGVFLRDEDLTLLAGQAGDRTTIVMEAGALHLEVPGVLVRCRRGLCARTRRGALLEGRLEGSHYYVRRSP